MGTNTPISPTDPLLQLPLFFLQFLVRVNNPWPNTIFFFEGPKLLLNLVSFTCSSSPINFKMEQKGQPQVSKFYQLSRCTSSPFDPKAENTWSLSPFQQRMQWAWELHTFTFTYLPILCFTQFFYNTHIYIVYKIRKWSKITKILPNPEHMALMNKFRVISNDDNNSSKELKSFPTTMTLLANPPKFTSLSSARQIYHWPAHNSVNLEFACFT